jgi:phosphate transport system substrate-binding protein
MQIASDNFILVKSWAFVLLLAATLAAPSRAECQAGPTLSQTRTLYVAPFEGGNDGALLRQALIKRLRKSGKYLIVESPNDADAIVEGHGEIWVKGHLTTNSRSPGVNRQTVFAGYLSVEVVSKGREPLWSYLVTPSKFVWGSIVDDLANNLFKEMLVAIEEKGQPVTAPGTKQTIVRTNLTGAGATFPAPLYKKWFETFQRQYPEIHLTYTAAGSELGTRMLADSKVDFAASDVASSELTASQTGVQFRRVAVVLGGVVPIYNVKGITKDLRFTPQALADIYLGKVTKWNDPEIKGSNKDVSLPDTDILVIHRSDGSGTSYAWSDFLSKASTAWKDTVGTGTTLKWPTGTGAERNEGVAAAVQATPNSIGYVELVYAIQQDLSYGAVRNSSGEYIRADLNSLAEAATAATRGVTVESPGSVTNPPGKGVYPIASFTWLLIPQEINDSAKKTAVLALLRWALTSGQKECSALGYAPLPREVAAQQLQLLSSFK